MHFLLKKKKKTPVIFFIFFYQVLHWILIIHFLYFVNNNSKFIDVTKAFWLLVDLLSRNDMFITFLQQILNSKLLEH